MLEQNILKPVDQWYPGICLGKKKKEKKGRERGKERDRETETGTERLN